MHPAIQLCEQLFNTEPTSLSEPEFVAAFLEALISLADVEVNDVRDVAGVLDAIIEGSDRHRQCAIFLVRSLGVRAINRLSLETSLNFPRRVVKICEKDTPDICDELNLSVVKQNFEKYNILCQVHENVLNSLHPLSEISSDLSTFCGEYQEVARALNTRLVRQYLAPYDFSVFSNHVKDTFNELRSILAIDDETFGDKFHHATNTVASHLGAYRDRSDFLAQDIAVPFFTSAEIALQTLGDDSIKQFACSLGLRRQHATTIERRYPLHEADRVVRVRLPLSNSGPGTAVSVSAEIACSDRRFIVQPETVDLGKVDVGDFSLHFDILVTEPAQSLSLIISLSWRTVRGSDLQNNTFECKILGQDGNVPWEDLARLDPYSTEVAEGDEFVGRENKVNALLSHLKKARMQSSFITGQKRVG